MLRLLACKLISQLWPPLILNNPLKQNKMVPFYSIKSSIKNLGKTVNQNSPNEDESTLKFNQILDDVEIESASSQNSTYNSSFYPQRLRSKTELRKE